MKNTALHLHYPDIFLEVFSGEGWWGEERGKRYLKFSVKNWERAP